jgi:hypothetical protein
MRGPTSAALVGSVAVEGSLFGLFALSWVAASPAGRYPASSGSLPALQRHGATQCASSDLRAPGPRARGRLDGLVPATSRDGARGGGVIVNLVWLLLLAAVWWVLGYRFGRRYERGEAGWKGLREARLKEIERDR